MGHDRPSGRRGPRPCGRSRPEPAGGVRRQFGPLCHHGAVRALARQGFCAARCTQGDDGGHDCCRAGLRRSLLCARTDALFRRLGHSRHGRQRDAVDRRLHHAQRSCRTAGQECDRRADAGDGPVQQHLLADHLVSQRSFRLARHLPGLRGHADPGLAAALCLRRAAPERGEATRRHRSKARRRAGDCEKHVQSRRLRDHAQCLRQFRLGRHPDRAVAGRGPAGRRRPSRSARRSA